MSVIAVALGVAGYQMLKDVVTTGYDALKDDAKTQAETAKTQLGDATKSALHNQTAKASTAISGSSSNPVTGVINEITDELTDAVLNKLPEHLGKLFNAIV